MSVMDEALQYRRRSAPRGDHAVLVDPAWPDLGALLRSNVEQARGVNLDFQGRSLDELRVLARRHLVEDALQYTRQYRDVELHPSAGETRSTASPSIILAGHQPQLFHPGVWCKNFALGALARQQRAVAINLQVDSDSVKRTSSRVPGGSVDQPVLYDVPFDVSPLPGVAFEEQSIHDVRQFESFGARAEEFLGPLVPDSLLGAYWPLAVDRYRATGKLGLALSQSRHQLVSQDAVVNLESGLHRAGGHEVRLHEQRPD